VVAFDNVFYFWRLEQMSPAEMMRQLIGGYKPAS